MDAVFRALADPVRRRLLDRLREREGQSLAELCMGMDIARQSVSKHLGILERANLVAVRRRGRERLHYLNAAPIQEIADRWIRFYHLAPADTDDVAVRATSVSGAGGDATPPA